VQNNPVNWVDPFGLEKLILYPLGDPFRSRADTDPDIPGVMKVYGHCNSDACGNESGKDMSDTDLIKRMIAAGWKKGMPFVIYGCSAGKGSDSVAARLSGNDKLGTEGWAPDSPLWDNWTWPAPYPGLSSNPGSGFPDLSNPGNWNRFINGKRIGGAGGSW
jgi:hypothetical protein